MPRLTNEEAFNESGRQLGLRKFGWPSWAGLDEPGQGPSFSSPLATWPCVNTPTVRIATIVEAFATLAEPIRASFLISTQ